VEVTRLRVLVGCEFSGVVRDAFRRRGHDAWSCDLLPNDSPYHFQEDVRVVVDAEPWDLAIFHPPCTYLVTSAAWAFTDGPYHQKVKPGTLVGRARRQAREASIEFVRSLLFAPIPHIALENPIGVLSSRVRKPDQVIHPYEFGHDASKGTCLWLKNLPRLKPTRYVEPRIVDGRKRWGNQTDGGQNKLSPSADRWKLRSITYAGIAEAMADQWGGDLDVLVGDAEGAATDLDAPSVSEGS
jgi:hypothetical protein